VNNHLMAKFMLNAKYGSAMIGRTGKSQAMTYAAIRNLVGIPIQCVECVEFVYRNAKGWMTYCNECHIHQNAPHLVALALEVNKGKRESRLIVWDEFPNGIVIMKDDYWMWEQIDGDKFHERKP